MNVTTETTKRFTVSDLTEDQAQDLLVLAKYSKALSLARNAKHYLTYAKHC